MPKTMPFKAAVVQNNYVYEYGGSTFPVDDSVVFCEVNGVQICRDYTNMLISLIIREQ